MHAYMSGYWFLTFSTFEDTDDQPQVFGRGTHQVRCDGHHVTDHWQWIGLWQAATHKAVALKSKHKTILLHPKHTQNQQTGLSTHTKPIDLTHGEVKGTESHGYHWLADVCTGKCAITEHRHPHPHTHTHTHTPTAEVYAVCMFSVFQWEISYCVQRWGTIDWKYWWQLACPCTCSHICFALSSMVVCAICFLAIKVGGKGSKAVVTCQWCCPWSWDAAGGRASASECHPMPPGWADTGTSPATQSQCFSKQSLHQQNLSTQPWLSCTTSLGSFLFFSK